MRDDAIHLDGEIVRPCAEMGEPARVLHHEIEDVAVNHQIAPSVDALMDGISTTSMPPKWVPQSHNDFVQKMLRKARKGAKMSTCRGNHDEFLRKLLRHPFRRH